MKIAISGTSGGFGKYAKEQWEGSNEVVRVNLRDSIEDIVNVVEDCDVFLNHAYSKDIKQSDVFYEVFNLWVNQPKTIINFGTSAILEDGAFSPKYVTNKKHLITLAQTLNQSNPHKKVRVVNFNPGTLENNKMFGNDFNKLKFKELFEIVDFILNLDNSIEISDIVIKNTTQKIKSAI